MDYTKALSMVENLLTIVEVGVPNGKKNEPRIIRRLGEYTLTFRSVENVVTFDDTIEYFWTKDKEIFETVARKNLEDEVIHLVRSSVNGEELTLERVKDVFRNLKSTPIQTFELLYHVYGVEYFKANPLEIGPYTIYNTNIHRSHLLEKYPHGKDAFDYELDKTKVGSNVMIGVCEKTRDSTRANEKGLVRLRHFEDTIRFMIGDPKKNYDAGIFNFNVWKRTGGLLLSNQVVGSTSSVSGAYEKILLHKFPINEPKFGHDKLWEMLNKENPTKLEKRIISSIGWAGKALRDEEPARALTQYVFALEALLQFQQRGSMVSPSITYQMAEFAAFILTDELEGRLEIEKIIKHIYARRSAIAHGGSNEVREAELYEAFTLLEHLITTLTINETFKDFTSIEEISEWVKIKKYS